MFIATGGQQFRVEQNIIPLYYPTHLAVVKTLLSGYSPHDPFHAYIKNYFKKNRKHGSKDRKLIASLCYHYFRLGLALKQLSVDDKILAGHFLCEQQPSAFLEKLRPAWNSLVSLPLKEKLLRENWQEEIDFLFPFTGKLSAEIDAKEFTLSFLRQPHLFLRIRPGNKDIIKEKLQQNNTVYHAISDDCIALPNASKIDSFIALDKEAVVQDYNSQRVGEFIQLALNDCPAAPDVWDCCAASGGKSLMAFDLNPSIRLAVSDKRKSILQNLQQRFERADIKKYTRFVADLSDEKTTVKATREQKRFHPKKFDLIIADVPCSGSGTWARTPEQLTYFKDNQIDDYSDLQQQIVKNAMPYLKTGGYLLYITCSVFTRENEDVVLFIEQQKSMRMIKTGSLKGYDLGADTLFAALFKRL